MRGEASTAAWAAGPGRLPQEQGKPVAISAHSGQGWEWQQRSPHLQPSVRPVMVAFMFLVTDGLNISSHLREALGIHIPVVGEGG